MRCRNSSKIRIDITLATIYPYVLHQESAVHPSGRPPALLRLFPWGKEIGGNQVTTLRSANRKPARYVGRDVAVWRRHSVTVPQEMVCPQHLEWSPGVIDAANPDTVSVWRISHSQGGMFVWVRGSILQCAHRLVYPRIVRFKSASRIVFN